MDEFKTIDLADELEAQHGVPSFVSEDSQIVAQNPRPCGYGLVDILLPMSTAEAKRRTVCERALKFQPAFAASLNHGARDEVHETGAVGKPLTARRPRVRPEHCGCCGLGGSGSRSSASQASVSV